MQLLGGLDPDVFMRRYWQRKPLVVRAAWAAPSFVAADDLWVLAARDDVESRLVQREGRHWTLTHGPLARGLARSIEAASPRPKADRSSTKRASTTHASTPPCAWTLLVQGVDLHVQAAHALLAHFRFVPWARLDDVMVSLAGDGGGVGPHVDEYDVFLLQLEGSRRWRVGRVNDPTLVRGAPLKLLRRFAPEHEWVLEAGDMLYLPPGWGHDGVALGPCMTASIGFRSPSADELARELLGRIADAMDDDESSDDGPADAQPSRRYADPRGGAVRHRGGLPAAMTAFAVRSVRQALGDPVRLRMALGEWLTEPKAQVVFEPPRRRAAHPWGRRGLVLDRRSRMLHDGDLIFLNGESFTVGGRDAMLLRELADTRCLDTAQARASSLAARRVLQGWIDAGWLRTAPDAGRA
jgi:50S ribosomal protein L16 3-hydroxylase